MKSSEPPAMRAVQTAALHCAAKQTQTSDTRPWHRPAMPNPDRSVHRFPSPIYSETDKMRAKYRRIISGCCISGRVIFFGKTRAFVGCAPPLLNQIDCKPRDFATRGRQIRTFPVQSLQTSLDGRGQFPLVCGNMGGGQSPTQEVLSRSRDRASQSCSVARVSFSPASLPSGCVACGSVLCECSCSPECMCGCRA